jgi:bifunctional UDP-N-acetylglucosamine pyrophosphorylase/glucosamine-1-phosphate N-acetyltransferase
MSISIVILAAGSGSRMKSSQSKLLHRLGGRPLITHLFETCQTLAPEQLLVVCGKDAEPLKATLSHPSICWVEQPRPLGTGDAVKMALPYLKPNNTVLILVGDIPLIRSQTLAALLKQCPADGLSLIVNRVSDPFGFGRIVRNQQGKISGIVEEKDASDTERAICEVNAGVFAVSGGLLAQFLPTLNNTNNQSEFYLTDIVAYAAEQGLPIQEVFPTTPEEVLGINTKKELAAMERVFQSRQVELLQAEGVQFLDPARVDIRGSLKAGKDVLVDVNVVFEGDVILGDGVQIGSHCVLKNCHLGVDTVVHPFSYIDGARTGQSCQIGPYARLRPSVELSHQVKIGNFVEIKNATVDTGAKINHLSYVGDAQIGQSVNIGAGTITCNYDGVSKHQTVIESGAFIGSNSVLIAPVKIGKDAFIGAGTALTKDAPSNQLTLARTKQQTVPQWKRPTKVDNEKENSK